MDDRDKEYLAARNALEEAAMPLARLANEAANKPMTQKEFEEFTRRQV